jgi:hypothetical protein
MRGEDGIAISSSVSTVGDSPAMAPARLRPPFLALRETSISTAKGLDEEGGGIADEEPCLAGLMFFSPFVLPVALPLPFPSRSPFDARIIISFFDDASFIAPSQPSSSTSCTRDGSKVRGFVPAVPSPRDSAFSSAPPKVNSPASGVLDLARRSLVAEDEGRSPREGDERWTCVAVSSTEELLDGDFFPLGFPRADPGLEEVTEADEVGIIRRGSGESSSLF